MIISRTPFRISFFGGGTDYPAWYAREEGIVLSTTIDKYCYLHCRRLPPFFGIKHRIVWSYIEAVSSMSDILHPAVREGMRYLGFDDSVGLEIQHQGDLPARSGMGSSSSFAVGLVHALTTLRGENLDRHELALKAIELEQDILKESVGSQDQVAAAYGGFNTISFRGNHEISVRPVSAPEANVRRLEDSLMLFYSGVSHHSSQSAQKTIESLKPKEAMLRRMRQMVYEAADILRRSVNPDDFGRLLHESWMTKRELTSFMTTPLIDEIYAKAMRNGALGGKLLGAGGRGFLIFYVPPEKQAAVREALAHFIHVPFRFENQGSVILYRNPNSAPLISDLRQDHPPQLVERAASRLPS